MSKDTTPISVALLWRELLRWLALCTVLSVVVGSVVAFFLWALDQVTALQWHYVWLVYLLPAAGLISGWLYFRFGQNCELGSGQIYSRIQQFSRSSDSGDQQPNESPEAKVPWHMAALVLVGTLLTHLFGGSAGREGTAIQVGGALASGLATWLRLRPPDTATLLRAGVAAGFGAVFGTPFAAALFAVEVVGCRVSRLNTIITCLFSAVLADRMTTWWGVQHTRYAINGETVSAIDLGSLTKIGMLSVAFGIVAWLFLRMTNWISLKSQRLIAAPWLRPVFGGLVIIALAWLINSRQYLGLGVEPNPLHPQDDCITSSFSSAGIDRLSWLWKSLFTAVTVGCGFKGGEATPLFYIGATSGNALGTYCDLSIDLAAGMGLVAVFAAVNRTPLACTMMAVELFAGQDASPLSAACLMIYSLTSCLIATTICNIRQLKIQLSKSE